MKLPLRHGGISAALLCLVLSLSRADHLSSPCWSDTELAAEDAALDDGATDLAFLEDCAEPRIRTSPVRGSAVSDVIMGCWEAILVATVLLIARSRPRGVKIAGRRGLLFTVVVGTVGVTCEAALITQSSGRESSKRDATAQKTALMKRSTQALRVRLDVELPSLPGPSQSLLNSAEEYAAQERWREALVLYLQAREHHQKEAALHFLTALAYVHCQRLREAQSLLANATKLLDQRKKQPSIRVAAKARLLCAVLVLHGNVNAQLPMHKVLESMQKDIMSRILKAAASDSLKPEERSFVIAALAALQISRVSDSSRADETAKSSLDLDPRNVFGMHVLGLAHMRRRNYARAQDVLKQAVLQDNDTGHQRLLVQCIWSQFESASSEDPSALVQPYESLQGAFPSSATFSAAVVIAQANAKKHAQAVKESNRTLALLANDPSPDLQLKAEVLTVRFVCLFAQSHYLQAIREMMQSTDLLHPISAACILVSLVCVAVLAVLSVLFGWEGCLIGLFGFVLLVLRGVFSMLLLSAVGSIYHVIENEPFPVPNALMLMF